MKKFIIILFLIIIIIIAVGVWLLSKKEKAETAPQMVSMENTLTGKKIAMIIAFKDFRDEEYFIPKEIFENNGAEVKTVSLELGKAVGSQGGETEVDLTVGDLDVSYFDAVVFSGGSGMAKLLDNQEFQRIVQEAVSQNKLLGAICIAPALLAKAGVLEGKEATVWSSLMDKSAVKILNENKAVYREAPVVQDRNIITANGPQSARQFGEKIVESLKNR